MNKTLLASVFALALVASVPAYSQMETEAPPVVEGAKPVTVQRIKIHGPSLVGNLEGNDVDRDALVFLPPSYQKERNRRYPVVYALHGFFIGAEQWSKEIHAPQTFEGAFALGAKEMIVVLPDSKTLHNGSMYSSSVTTGDFENYVARDVVAYMDANYRTLPARESRGLVGHSMGGYGATRIGMKHSDVFGSLYVMSPCCLGARGAPPKEALESLAKIKRREDLAKQHFMVTATFAVASAWSPNPKNPPFYADLPLEGDGQSDILAKWAANAPFAFIDQHIGNLKQYRAIALDVGDQDGLRVDTAKLHQTLNDYGIENTFEEYAGTHTSKLGDRFQNHVLKFFSDTLCFEKRCGK